MEVGLVSPDARRTGFFVQRISLTTTAMPGKGRPFVKGVSGNPGGRPKVLGDVQELARQKSPEAIIRDAKAPPPSLARVLLVEGFGLGEVR